MAETKKTAGKDIQFEAEVREVNGRTIVQLPQDASDKLRSRGQVAVRVSINGTSRDTVAEPDGMKGHWLEVPAREDRSESGSGENVSVQIEQLDEWPEPEIPQDFHSALAEASDAAAIWHDITPMARWEWVRWVGATKSADTRERRIDVSMSKLESGKRRHCCFDLSSCTDPELSKNGKLLGLS